MSRATRAVPRPVSRSVPRPVTPPNPDEPVPIGFRIELDPSAKELEPGVWFGGSPARVLRLTPGGRRAWDVLRTAGVTDPAAGRLARRLTDAGIAHPRPPAAPAADVTVLIPVLDRPAQLARCLAALGGEHPVIVVDDGSRDPDPIADVARAHGARLIRRDVNGGPAAARNTGLAAVDTALVAFVDSDCTPPPGWLTELAGHLADPLLAAVAPRIRASSAEGWAGRYGDARGGLDLGQSPGRVAPNGRVAYVPTAALLARREALLSVGRGDYVFDPALRFGEDVDLVWRLDAAGWRVRYDPSVQVAHDEPARWGQLLRRRYQYGTSAAPLSRAHPDAIAPLRVHVWPALTVGGLLARRPLLAAGAFAMAVRTTTSTLRAADVPTAGTTAAMADAVRQTGLGLGRYTTQFAAPLLLAGVAAPGRPGRRLAALSLLLGPPLAACPWRRGGLDPARFVLGHLADEIAYGTGVWAGCREHRTTTPIRPAVAWRGLRGRRPTREQGDRS